MIDWLIFSRNRPLQLQALVDSMDDQNVPRLSCSVLYRADGSEMEASYAAIRAHAVTFRRDHSGFENGVRGWLEFVGPAIGFLTDDCLFYRPARMPDRAEIPYSYRLGRNTVRTSTIGIDSQPPDTLTWDWHGKPGDFGYPLALDGHVYLIDTIYPVIEGLRFQNPTELEAGMAANWQRFTPTHLTMAEHSCLVSIPHNRVSDSSGCPISDDPRFAVERLHEAFKSGQRIRPDRMDFSNVTDAHQEIPYVID